MIDGVRTEDKEGGTEKQRLGYWRNVRENKTGGEAAKLKKKSFAWIKKKKKEAYSESFSERRIMSHSPTEAPAVRAHAPFCQVMAGRGAPEVSQCRMTDMLSITALSEGPAVILGAMPKRGGEGGVSHTHTHTHTQRKHTQGETRSGKTGVIMSDIKQPST